MRTCPRCSSLYVNDVLCCGLDGERLVDVDRDPLLGTTLDRYRIQAPLGHGGMARVYRAQHVHLGHAVALKVLHGDTASDRRRVERFRREAASAAQLHHPNVVQVHDFGVSPDGLVFMAMELLEGATLAQRLEEGRRFGPSEIAELVRQVALGLGSAHRLGFVHRDLNPKNLMLVDGPRGLRVVILDFGLVRMLDSTDPRLTVHGQVYGTPAYMAPEQIVDGELDARTDLYALGVILYELLAGRRPFAGAMGDVLDKHTRGRAAPLDDRTGLGALALTLMAKSPAERPASAEAVVATLEALGLVRSTTTSSMPAARAAASVSAERPSVASAARPPATASATRDAAASSTVAARAEPAPPRASTPRDDEALPTVVLSAIEALDARSLMADARHEAVTLVPVATPEPRRPSYPTEAAIAPPEAVLPPSVAAPPADRHALSVAAPPEAFVAPSVAAPPADLRAPSVASAPPRAVASPPRASSVRRTARPTRAYAPASAVAPEPAVADAAPEQPAHAAPAAPSRPAAPAVLAAPAANVSLAPRPAPAVEPPRDAELLAPVAVVAMATTAAPSGVPARSAVDEVTTPIRVARRARPVMARSAHAVEASADGAEDPELAAMMANAKPAWPALAVTSGLFALGAVFAYPWLLGAHASREAEAPVPVVSAAPAPAAAASGLVGVVPAGATRASTSPARAASPVASARAAGAPSARALPSEARASTRAEAAPQTPEAGPARGGSKLLPRLSRRTPSTTPTEGASASAADPDEPDERPAVAPQPVPAPPAAIAPPELTPPIGGPSATTPAPLTSPLVSTPSPLLPAPSPLLPPLVAQAPPSAVVEAPAAAPSVVVAAPAVEAPAPPAIAPTAPAPVAPLPEAALPEAALPEVVLPPSGALPAVELPLSELVPVEADLPLELVRAAMQSPPASPAPAEVLTSTITR